MRETLCDFLCDLRAGTFHIALYGKEHLPGMDADSQEVYHALVFRAQESVVSSDVWHASLRVDSIDVECLAVVLRGSRGSPRGREGA